MEITLAVKPDDEVRALVKELNDELGALYPPEQRHGLALEAIFQPHIRFFLAHRDGLAVGCAGFARTTFAAGWPILQRRRHWSPIAPSCGVTWARPSDSRMTRSLP